MTGQEMTELFFTKVKGWEKGDFLLRTDTLHGLKAWYKYKNEHGIGKNTFPKLHTSLDLQEEWVWPELHKLDIWRVELQQINNDSTFFVCEMGYKDGVATTSTKALAQLEASLKALRVMELPYKLNKQANG